MDGSPQLLTDVKFTQLKRGGYDPDQVDNFLERVSAAVAQLQDKLRVATDRAETADAQIAEARRLQVDAEATAQAAGAASGPSSVVAAGGDDELKKVLVLAQRAADQAVDEANTTATSTLADARAKAVNLVAEAEQERDLMLAKARKKADATTEERTHELQQRLKVLEAARVDLEADVDAMQGYLDTARVQLLERLAPVRLLLDDPRGFRLAERPELRNPTLPDDELDSFDDPDAGEAASRPDGSPESPSNGDGAPRLDGGPDVDSSDATPEDEPISPSLTEPDIEADPGSDKVGETDQPLVESQAADEPVVAEAVVDLSWAAGSVASSNPAGGAPETIDLTSERLFGDAAEEGDVDAVDAGPRTEIFSPSYESSAPEPAKAESVADSPLGEPDEAADAAMRAFFDVDLESATDTPKPARFGRRR
jgi:DivIVA domain-containing protein